MTKIHSFIVNLQAIASIMQPIANIKLDPDITIKEYLYNCLKKLWEEGEGFSGKRPFGCSSWQLEIMSALVREGLISGEFKYGYLEDCDQEAGKKIISDLISYIFWS